MEWCDLAESACRARGSGEKMRLSKMLDVHNSTVTRVIAGQVISPELMLRISLELGIRPPKMIALEPDEWRALLVASSIKRAGGRARLYKVLDVLEALAKRVSVLVALRTVADQARRAGMTEIEGGTLPDRRDVDAQIEMEWERAGFGLPLPEAPPIPFPSETDQLVASAEAKLGKKRARR
jgi:hypothetical protein